MSLLSKTNPKATWRSVVLQGLIKSVLGTSLYGAILWWNQWFDDWPLKISICAILTGLVGAIFEWQVPADDGLDEIASQQR